MRIGAHVPMNNSLHSGRVLGADVAQIHLGSPRQWMQTKTPQGATFQPVYVHAPYLINLSAADPQQLANSRQLLHKQSVEAAKIGAKGLVVHGGSFKGSDWNSAMDQWVDAMAMDLHPTPILIENAANGKHSMTRHAEDFSVLMEEVRGANTATGWCLDTAHLWAATDNPNSEFEYMMELMGPPALIHANGSKVAMGSGKDSHSPYALSASSIDWIVGIIRDSRVEDVIVESSDPIADVALLKARLLAP